MTVYQEDIFDFDVSEFAPISEQRKECSRCLRSQSMCLCSHLPDEPVQFSSDTLDDIQSPRCSVIVFQHSNECGHKKSTGHLIPEVLGYARIYQCKKIIESPKSGVQYSKSTVSFDSVLSDLRDTVGSQQRIQPVLIFPSKNAISMDQFISQQLLNGDIGGSDRNSTEMCHYVFIFIDATWPSAIRLRSGPLANLPSIVLDVNMLQQIRDQYCNQPSRYSLIRKEIDNGMSTLEAVACCLYEFNTCIASSSSKLSAELQNHAKLLMRVFDQMVDMQLQHIPVGKQKVLSIEAS
ncbi:hypothetical protein MIR68_005681 [Amoeboaphelidium protococcarum]|nr:hypothetical protein MIR68_005681 [Amoeboaphelidium protococcarum]